ncbi:MAG TPA: sulfatase [Fimbriimonas sp.]
MRILHLDIDSLRPDHLGCYGYHRNTSPNIDALATESLRFSNYYVTDSPCLPSRTALISGRFGITTGVVNHGGVCADIPPEGPSRGFRSRYSATTLGSVLRSAGLWTASISPFPWRHTAYQMFYGFNETIDTGGGGLENADEIYPHVRDWIERHADRDDWYLHVNFWDPHTPYDAPIEFGNPFEDDPIDPWITEEVLAAQRSSYGPHSATEVRGYEPVLDDRTTLGVPEIRGLADAKRHMDGYDTGIRYVDHYLGLIFQQLKDAGIWDETAVVVTADHGESQGELNVWGDHQTADHTVNRVPLIVKWPGITDPYAGKEHPGLFYHIDFAATLADLCGADIPVEWEGASFSQRLSPSDPGRDHLVLSQGAWCLQRAVRWENWILIRTYHTGLKDLRKWMLFDLSTDPHETTNLAPSRPEIVAEGEAKLEAFLAEKLPSAWRGDPFEIVLNEGGAYHANENGPEWLRYLERLRQTGRTHHAEWLEQHGGKPREG